MRCALAVALTFICGACGPPVEGIQTEFVGSYPFTPIERRTIARIAGDAVREVRPHLPALASHITLRVQSGEDVIAEVGATAAAIPPDWVSWTVHPGNPKGVVAIAEAHLRGALFHEFHHLVRGGTITPTTLMDHVVTEGLATAFERDFAGVSRPWADYPGDVSNWVDELVSQPANADRDDWLLQHPDGRRWIGFKAGTYLVDRTMKRLQRSSADLVATPTKEFLVGLSLVRSGRDSLPLAASRRAAARPKPPSTLRMSAKRE